ncbi:MAG: hypothetical protein WAN69_03005 [Candidatus Korobacteraceae bacterium]
MDLRASAEDRTQSQEEKAVSGGWYMKILRTFVMALLGLSLAAGIANAQGPTWTALTHQPTFSASNPLLLTDGTVIAHQTSSVNWWRLTPDINGNYINGTWSAIAPLPAGYAPLYFGSAVLPDGNVIIEGGEYNLGNDAWTTLGAYYDSVANTWISVTPPAGWGYIGDAAGIVLPNGTYMQTDCCDQPPLAALFDETTKTWTPTGAGKADIYDEEGLTLMPNGNLLTVDAYVFSYDATGTNSEIYNTAAGTWSSAGSTIQQLWDSYPNEANASYEVGPASLRPDGTVIATGATGAPGTPGRAAVYNTHTGTWSPAPSFPTVSGVNNLDCSDAPAALLPNGNVLVSTSPGIFNNGVKMFEWDGTNWNNVPATARAARESSYVENFLVLPTGQVLATDNGRFAYVYTPTGAANPAWAPQIIAMQSVTNYTRGGAYTVYGTRFNGMAQGAVYGDDVQAASNYPIVRFTNNSTGHVFYGRTSNMKDSTGNLNYGVQTPGVMSTTLQVPAGMETGLSSMVVTVNGIASNPINVNIH